jgi:3-phosphoshikimate 1-carboxyvinyltransferase
MKLVVERAKRLEGTVRAPPSKSHMHRAVAFASLARGRSAIRNPSFCDDCLATLDACGRFGARIAMGETIAIDGVGGMPKRPDAEINARGSGTTMRLMAAVSALCEGATTLTGDQSLRKRQIAPLLAALSDLGAPRARSLNNDGCPPVCVGGRMGGGSASLDAGSSQHLSALLLACPLAENDSLVEASGLKSSPYVAMTLEHLGRTGARAWNSDMARFFIPGGQEYKPVDFVVPGDHSAAAFLLAAAEATDSEVEITGLDPEDSQGDRAMAGFIREMSSGRDRVLDLGQTPDLLPALAVLACVSDGITVLCNVQHARGKESDRVHAMAAELGKMGAVIEEMTDGLKIRGSGLRGAEVYGHGDHRVVMALAVAGLAAEGRTIISGGDAISKSYPGFVEHMASLGAKIRAVE